MYHSTLGLRVRKKKEKVETVSAVWVSCPAIDSRLESNKEEEAGDSYRVSRLGELPRLAGGLDALRSHLERGTPAGQNVDSGTRRPPR